MSLIFHPTWLDVQSRQTEISRLNRISHFPSLQRVHKPFPTIPFSCWANRRTRCASTATALRRPCTSTLIATARPAEWRSRRTCLIQMRYLKLLFVSSAILGHNNDDIDVLATSNTQNSRNVEVSSWNGRKDRVTRTQNNKKNLENPKE